MKKSALYSLLLTPLAAGATFLPPSPARADTSLLDRLPPLPPAPAAPAPKADPEPAQIPAREKVDGLFVVLQPEAIRRPNEYAGYHTVFVTTNAERASEFAKTGQPLPNAVVPPPRPTTCLEGTGDSWQVNQAILPRPRPAWDPAPKKAAAPPAAPTKRAKRAMRPPHPKSKAQKPPAAKIKTTHLMRTEAFVVGTDGQATLERTEMWVDYVTLGARLVGKTSVPYTRLSVGPHGLELYGARGPDGTVDVIFRTPEEPNELGPFQAEELGAGSSIGSANGCGILKGTLSLEEGGASAIVMGQVALEGRAADDTEPDPDDANEAKADGAPHRILHSRPLEAVLSYSKTASEATPVLSVSYGWVGRDERLETDAPARCVRCQEARGRLE